MAVVTRPRLTTFFLGLVGAVVFLAAGLPLPMLLGPLAACLFAAMAGAQLDGFGKIGGCFRAILGLTAGSSISPEIIGELPRMAASLAFVPLFVIVIGLIGYPLFRRVFKFDPVTSYYSAMPGGLADMLVFGQEAGGNVRVMSLIHTTRIVIIVTLAPLVMGWLWQVDLSATPGIPATETPLSQMALLSAAAIVGWWAAAKIGMFGASILGPLIVTAVLTLSGIVTARPPMEVIMAAQFAIGCAVGSKYSGITWEEVRRIVFAGVVYALILAAITVGFLLELGYLLDGPAMETFLSFLPGGQGEMVLIAFIAGADLTFVVAHHIVRLFLVLSFAPLIARWAVEK